MCPPRQVSDEVSSLQMKEENEEDIMASSNPDLRMGLAAERLPSLLSQR